jgi:hypothetical protein
LKKISVKRHREALVVASKATGLEANADKTMYSRDHNAGRIHNVQIDNSNFKSVEKFRYLGTTVSNENSVE